MNDTTKLVLKNQLEIMKFLLNRNCLIGEQIEWTRQALEPKESSTESKIKESLAQSEAKK